MKLKPVFLLAVLPIVLLTSVCRLGAAESQSEQTVDPGGSDSGAFPRRLRISRRNCRLRAPRWSKRAVLVSDWPMSNPRKR